MILALLLLLVLCLLEFDFKGGAIVAPLSFQPSVTTVVRDLGEKRPAVEGKDVRVMNLTLVM